MKGYCLIFILLIFISFTGCTNEMDEVAEKNEKVLMVLKDNVFIQSTNDMYLNPSFYAGKEMQIDGLIYLDTMDDGTHVYVVRRTPGCCGSDGLAGLEVKWDGEIPEQDAWVSAKGEWKKSDYAPNGWILMLNSLEEKEERGNEFVQ